MCTVSVVMCEDGSFLRHPDPPSPVTVWPGCPRRYEAVWSTSPYIEDIESEGYDENRSFMNLCSAFSPKDYMEWSVECGKHRGRITAGAEFLFREYLKTRDVPGIVQQIKAHKEAEQNRKRR